MRTTEICGGLLLLITGGGLVAWLAATPAKPEIELAGFATSLRGRTASQRHNAEKAARALDGKIIAPGAEFSFNKVVKSWSWDQGYVKAPVSYEGELIRAYGGGVCQTSTTLYNAALLAGLPVVERHPHVFAAHYAPPGRDAAVAQFTIDLRFRNPYSWPLRLSAKSRGERLIVQIFGRERPKTSVQIASDVLSVTTPQRLTRVLYRPESATGRTFVRNPGATGYRVVTQRIFTEKGREVRRERLGDDTYPVMNKIVQRTEEGGVE
jgi:vancomycin resistance protein VanW